MVYEGRVKGKGKIDWAQGATVHSLSSSLREELTMTRDREEQGRGENPSGHTGC